MPHGLWLPEGDWRSPLALQGVPEGQNGKRQVVVVIRERGGSILLAVFKSESAARPLLAL